MVQPHRRSISGREKIMAYHTDEPEFHTDIVSYAAASLREISGLDQDKCQSIAEALANEIRRNWGGQSTYIAKGQALDISARDKEIHLMYNGHNMHQVIKKFGLTEQWIHQIIKRVHAAELERRQPDMFERRS